MFVVFFDTFLVDGNYSEWSEFMQCSVTCGKGVQTRSRSCINPPPQHGGKNCSAFGPAVETKECKLKECPSKNCNDYNYSAYTLHIQYYYFSNLKCIMFSQLVYCMCMTINFVSCESKKWNNKYLSGLILFLVSFFIWVLILMLITIDS